MAAPAAMPQGKLSEWPGGGGGERGGEGGEGGEGGQKLMPAQDPSGPEPGLEPHTLDEAEKAAWMAALLQSLREEVL